MTAVQYAHSIYQRAKERGKMALLYEEREKELFDLLAKEGRTDKDKIKIIGFLMPDGTLKSGEILEFEDSMTYGEENIKCVCFVRPKERWQVRQGFKPTIELKPYK